MSTGTLHMTNRALHLPGRVLRGIGLDACRSGCIRSPAVAVRDGDCFAAVGGVRGEAPSRNITIPLEDIFSGNLRIFFE